VHDAAPVARGGDVEEDEFVRALGVVGLGALHRIAGITQLLKLDALDDATGVDVETGNDAAGEHGKSD
jgi:hypothetical protein